MEKVSPTEKQSGLPLPLRPGAVPKPSRLINYRLLIFAAWIVTLCLWTLHYLSTGETNPRAFAPRRHRFLHPKEAEELFLTVPNNVSAHAASVHYATKPHLAGNIQDLITAKDYLNLLQTELGITPPVVAPIFEAGSHESQDAIKSLTNPRTWRNPHTRFAPTAWIDTYYPVLNTPLDRHLEVLAKDGKVVWKADLEEVADDADPASEYAHTIGTWHGLSKGGEATGRVVYVEYGRKADFDALVADGVDFKGTIALARYGQVFRGLKIKAAQEVGCVGILIYSDTRDDGSVTVENGYEAYPHGPARNPTSVQRGSAQFLSMYPGDPTTPGVPSYANVTREEARNIPSIPSIPISSANAQKLLKEIEKDADYVVRIVNNVDDKVTPIWNTMAFIPGIIRDEVVVIGNHRDAWVMGAGDPTSGTVASHEVIRGFGVLLKRGWKPLRSILIASWDAEEYGLVGSTEWGEDFADWIQEHVVAYLNLDVASSGSRYNLESSPSLAHLLRQAASEVPHPTDKGRTLWDARLDQGKLTGPAGSAVIAHAEAAAADASKRAEISDVGLLKPLGSGSDYTVMLQRLGIASTDMGFASTLSDPVYHYHSVYDSVRFQEVYGDVGFHRHVAVAKHYGLITLRLANSFVLPINTTQYALELDSYLDKVEDISDSLALSSAALKTDLAKLRSTISSLQEASGLLDIEKEDAENKLKEALHKLLEHRRRAWQHHRPGACSREGGRLRRFKDWVLRIFGAQREQHRHPYHQRPHRWSTSSLLADAFSDSPTVVDRVSATMVAVEGFPHAYLPGHLFELFRAAKRVRKVNFLLSKFEQGFLSEGGIKDREWYRHLGTAPGKWLGYGATTFPALTEALTFDKSVDAARYEARRLNQLLESMVERLTL